jgi:hypothetical protein
VRWGDNTYPTGYKKYCVHTLAFERRPCSAIDEAATRAMSSVTSCSGCVAFETLPMEMGHS